MKELTMTHGGRGIGAVVGADRATVQALFVRVAAEWRAAGAEIVGMIAEPHGIPDRACSAGVLRDILSGKPFPIYLDMTPSHTSCHLDPAGVEAACAELLPQIPMSALVVLSKFGKLEAMGRGLIDAFKVAAASGKPVLTTVSQKHCDAWRRFAPHATYLAADVAVLGEWWRAQGHATEASSVP